MAEIGNVRPTPPIKWPPQPITPAEKKKDQHSEQKNQKQPKDKTDNQDDDNHVDEYA